MTFNDAINPLNAELNPIYYLLALLGGATIAVVSRLRVNQRFCSEMLHAGTTLTKFMKIQNI